MTMGSWIRKLLACPVADPVRKRPRRARLAVEALEQRWVPSFTVTNLLDDGSLGSLRWAVGQANANPGDNTFDFDPTVFATPQTITLAGTQLELSNTTALQRITGPAAGVTVSGNNASRVFHIAGGVSASISGLTISMGHVTGTNDGGGGILNRATLTLTNCTVSGNSTAANGSGAGLANLGGTLTLADCTVSGNFGRRGGGLYSQGGTTTLTGCTVSGNSSSMGGGMGTDFSTLTLTDCTVSGNSAAVGAGGGLYCNSSITNLTNCSVNNNSADNGGGLSTYGANTSLNNCTVSGNSATDSGGGMETVTHSAATLTNCTVSGNSATGNMGGGGGLQIDDYSTATLTNCTVSGNSATPNIQGGAGGIEIIYFSTTTLTNSIVAANTSVGNPSDISGYVINASSSYNLIGPGGSGGLIDGLNHNQVGVANPGLGTLGDHGGPTQTIDLLGGSPALNAGDPAQLGLADQRGVVRSGGVNIGAYQASATAFLVSAPDTVQSGVPFDVTVTAMDPFNQMAVGYTGTVHFSTTDTGPGVVLPADYAFALSDGGMHRFTDTGLGEVTLVTPGAQTLTVMDTADNTITGSADLTVSAGPAPHGQGPPPSTVPPRPAQGEAPATSEPSASGVVGLERWFASSHDGDYVWLTAPRLNHRARGYTTLGMADLFGGDDLLFS
jgi:parallel beta-helix repeat protein